MPAQLRDLSKRQLDAILDRQGHEPCPGVRISPLTEIRAKTPAAPAQSVIIFEPSRRPSKPAPALLAFHGGGFFGGDPYGVGALAKTLALTLGVVTISASYRLGTADKPTGPAILDDAARAWGWTLSHAAELGLDPARLAVAGESAGCLLAGHLAVGSPFVAKPGAPAPRAFLALWGPLDFVARWYDNGENPGAEVNVFGPGGFPARPAAYHALSVLTHANHRALPPALFIYGRNDPVVHPRQGALGAAAWQAQGCHAGLLVLPNIGHCAAADSRSQHERLLLKAAEFCACHHAA